MKTQIPLKAGWILDKESMQKELSELPEGDSLKGRELSDLKFWLWIDDGPLVGHDDLNFLKDLYAGS